MKGIYKQIDNNTGGAETITLITKGSGDSGNIKKILIANENTYILYNKIDIPAKTSLVLTNNVSFNVREFSLRLTTTGGVDCTIVIK